MDTISTSKGILGVDILYDKSGFNITLNNERVAVIDEFEGKIRIIAHNGTTTDKPVVTIYNKGE